MKKILLVAAIATLTTSAFAADLKPYIEGSLGYANPSDLTIGSFYDSDDATYKTYKGTYDSGAIYGIEVGLKNINSTNFRLGGEFSTAKFDQKSGLSTWANGRLEPDTALESNRSKFYMLNAYYDFDVSPQFKPFLGFGGGVVKGNGISTEFAWQGSVGGKYYINNNIYIGAKGSYTRANGASIGSVKLDDTDMYAAKALLGFEF